MAISTTHSDEDEAVVEVLARVDIRTLVRAARDAGIDFFDHAAVYGTDMHGCERRFAEALKLSPSERAEITIQTKAGIVKDGPYFDFSYEHLISSAEGSLRALQTDYLDVFLLHRPDALVEPDDVAREALDEVDPADEEAAARTLVRKKLRSLSRVDDTTATRRLVGMLARKGYGSGLAYAVVKDELATSGRQTPDPDVDVGVD